MKNGKAIKILSMLAVLVLLISACSQQGAPVGSDASPSGSEEPSKAQENSVSNESKANDIVELTLWQHETPPHRINAIQGVIDDFNAKNPDIKVTQEVVLWEDETAKMLAATRSGILPDMNVATDTSWSTAYLAGAIIPADDIVKDIDAKEKLYQPGIKGYYYDGHYWGVPINCSTWNLMYRPSILKKAGYDRPPETWSELLEYAEKCTFADEGVYGIGLASGRNGLTNDQFLIFLISKGLDYFDENGNIAFNTPATIETAEFFTNLLKFSSPSSTSWGWGEIEMNFAAGNIAMTPYLSPNLPGCFDEGMKDVATAPMPAPDGMSVAESNKMILNHAITVTKGAESPGHYEAVKKFIMHALEPEMIWILTIGQEPGFFFPPTQTGMELVSSGYMNKEYLPLKDFDYTEGSADRKILENFAEVGSGFKWNGYATGRKYGVTNLALTELDEALIVADMVQKITIENTPVSEAVKWADDRMTALSDEAKSIR